MTLRRRDFIAASASAAGIASLGLGAPAFAQAKPFTTITPFGYIPDFGELMNGVTGGHFAKYGLDVKVAAGTGTASAVTQVIAGQAKIMRCTAIDLFQVAKSQPKPPLVAVATIYQTSAFQVISDKSKPIDTVEQMKGKTVGVVSVGGSTELLLNCMLIAKGINPADVKREVTGNSAGAFALIGQGRIDCFIASLAVVNALQQTNAPISFFSTDKYAPMPGQVYSVTPDTIAKEPDSIVAWLKGVRDSVKELSVSNDYPKILERMGKTYEIPGIKNVATLKLANDEAVQSWNAMGKENLLRNVPKLFAEGADILVKAGIAKVDKVTDYYTNEFIDKALKG